MKTPPVFKKTTEDRDIEQVMGNLLRFGVIVAAIVASVGGAIYLAQHAQDTRPSYQDFKGVSPEYTSFLAVLKGVIGGNCISIMQLGVLLLIGTPIARILFSLASFVKEKDYLYVVISLLVMIVISFSVFHGTV